MFSKANEPPSQPLSEFPFLNAALEDYSLAIRLAGEGGNSRQSVCFMHDALEFLLYQILSARDCDIYKNGQNTIGFDAALDKCKSEGISLPLITIIREIQKRRGDAKHHAQKPNDIEFNRITAGFKILFTVMCFEQFGDSEAILIASKLHNPYHIALHDLYRRAERNRNWKLALPFALRALLHKRRAIYSRAEDFATHLQSPSHLLSLLEATSSFSATSEESSKVKKLVQDVKKLLTDGHQREATETLALAFSELDFIAPTIFSIKDSKKFTERLYQGRSIAHTGMWTMEVHKSVEKVLKANPDLVKRFGRPYRLEDDDRYSEWWEFVVFDGSRWLPFHLGTDFRISSDPTAALGKPKNRPPHFSELVASEFEKALLKITP